jgi:hypothetical protein
MARHRMSLTVLLAVLAAAMILFVPSPAMARPHWGGGFYGGWYGPYYPYGPYGYWGPYYSPYGWGAYGYPYYGPDGYYYGGRRLGEVRIKSPDKNASVYINGSYAGRAHDLKRFYLKPGAYSIELRTEGQVWKHRIYVLADRSVKIDFTKAGPVAPEPPPPPPPPPPE